MKLTWRQFECYQEAFHWIGNQYSEEGKRDATRFDLEYTRTDPRLKAIKQAAVERANAALAKIRERQNRAALQ